MDKHYLGLFQTFWMLYNKFWGHWIFAVIRRKVSEVFEFHMSHMRHKHLIIIISYRKESLEDSRNLSHNQEVSDEDEKRQNSRPAQGSWSRSFFLRWFEKDLIYILFYEVIWKGSWSRSFFRGDLKRIWSRWFFRRWSWTGLLNRVIQFNSLVVFIWILAQKKFKKHFGFSSSRFQIHLSSTLMYFVPLNNDDKWKYKK